MKGREKPEREETKRRNLESYGLRIKAFRLRRGLAAEELAERLGVNKSSVRNWECGLTRPDPALLPPLFALLDVEPNEFFGVQGVGTLLTGTEKRLVEDFRALDERGREDAALLVRSLREKAAERRLLSARKNMVILKSLGRVVAAGDGEDWPEHPEPEELILYASPQTLRCDEIFTVNGASMEPQFSDDDRVLVEYCTELKNGDIGVFYVPGRGGLIKQRAYDRLHSLNPAYDDIFPFEDGARVVGRVLGKLTRELIPAAAEQQLYREALAAGEGA